MQVGRKSAFVESRFEPCWFGNGGRLEFLGACFDLTSLISNQEKMGLMKINKTLKDVAIAARILPRLKCKMGNCNGIKQAVAINQLIF